MRWPSRRAGHLGLEFSISEHKAKHQSLTRCATSRHEQSQQSRVSIRPAPGAYCIGCSVAVRSEITPSFGASTVLGSRIVKTDPRPVSLATVMSPPIIWQNRRLIARPSPVPPYLLAVVEEAC